MEPRFTELEDEYRNLRDTMQILPYRLNTETLQCDFEAKCGFTVVPSPSGRGLG